MTYVPVSREAHGNRTWKRSFGYERARTDLFAPLVAAELTKAGADMPLCFLKTGENFIVAALLTIVPGRNLFVAPDGRWLGSYVPAWYRSYPFRLLRKEGTTEQVLCVDDTYEGLGQGEETFFAEDGKPSKAVAEILQFTAAIENNRTPTDLAVAALNDAGLIVPWEINVQHGENATPVNGVFRVDEKALEEIEDDVHLKLRKAGALPIAYAQLLSIGRLSILGKLYELHARMEADRTRAAPASDAPRISFGDNDELLF